jgi:hypothetical protein
MDYLFFGLLFFGALAVFAAVFAIKGQDRRGVWELAAENLGLTYSGDQIVGDFQGARLSVKIVSRGTLDSTEILGSRERFTVFTFQLILPSKLVITRQGFLGSLSTLVGAQDIQIGLPDLDSVLLVKGENVEEVRAWARQDTVAQGLRDLIALNDVTFKLEGGYLIFERAEEMSILEDVEQFIRQFSAIALRLSPAVLRPEPSVMAMDAEPVAVSVEDSEEEKAW